MKMTEYIQESNGIENRKKQWKEVLKTISKKTAEQLERERIRQEEKDFVQLINQAKEDWKNAQIYFEEVTDPDLIELAIYQMEAAKVFYMYLLKEAKRKGISA
ncbi:DUF2508 family protein [Garciella nitratireducens]|uniref:DUF2508 domain-containing protein n=1 Tax=Garciella nitratireducens DSM 15102 TaxID=1121911 RepID=A0A1T4NFZ7_9FIRM|nr:DUF2508 family protein [Garciella nitratireducens]RBP42868.1 uncharacterized protein DUF2508 [Garciella nitratireducens]SJZ78291.1 Protein of unknown function [Garciella nitratireducens DSM 15102]